MTEDSSIHPHQTRVPPPRDVEPDPTDFDCEWCGPGHKAEVRVPIKKKNQIPTGQSIYVCRKHEHLAEAMSVR